MLRTFVLCMPLMLGSAHAVAQTIDQQLLKSAANGDPKMQSLVGGIGMLGRMTTRSVSRLAVALSPAAVWADVPLGFEANVGQTNAHVQALARGNGYTMFLSLGNAVLSLRLPAAHQTEAIVRMKLLGANAAPRVEKLDQLPGVSNYLIGNDPAKWRTAVPRYARIAYRDVFPGVDIVYYGAGGQLEFDLLVAPRANTTAIRLVFDGVRKMRIDDVGDLVLTTDLGEVRQRKPRVYQVLRSGRKWISGGYVIHTGHQVGFRLAQDYDPSAPVVIDPVFTFSTYLGGKGGDDARAIAVDSDGNVYVAGVSTANDFPTRNPFQASNKGGTADVIVTKLNATGSNIIYSTYLGGSQNEILRGMAVDVAGNVYLTGLTNSSDFPTSKAFQAKNAGGSADAFVSKLNAAGNGLVYSTYLGGASTDGGHAIAVDAQGSAYVVGETLSDDFPTASALQPRYGGGTRDGFIAKFNPAGSALVYSTYLGGPDFDQANGVAVDSSGNAYVAGDTQYSSFPTTPGAFQTKNGGGIGEGFVLKLNASGSAFLYSTRLGGNSNDVINAVAIDSSGNAYVTGYTGSTDFPLVRPVQRQYQEFLDAFVTKLNPDGTALVYSTYLGGRCGNGADVAYAIAVDSFGAAYVTGKTSSSNFPVTPDALQPTFAAGGGKCSDSILDFSDGPNPDAFVTKLSPTGSALAYSSFLGSTGSDQGNAIAVDLLGNIYVAGATTSSAFPTRSALQPAYGGGAQDLFVSKIDFFSSLGLTVAPVRLEFLGIPGGSIPDQDLRVTAVAGQASWRIETATESGGNWIRATPTVGTSSGVVHVSVTTGGLTSGEYQGTVAVVNQTTQSRLELLVTLKLASSSPQFTADGVVNAASFLPGPLAPGSLFSIFGVNLANSTMSAGPLPPSLDGVSMTIGGFTAPVQYISPGQINAQVPFEVAPGQQPLEYTKNGVKVTVTVTIVPARPGIFLVNGRGAILNQDNSLNTSLNAALVGSAVQVFFTGQGLVTPALATGAPASLTTLMFTNAPTTATIGGAPATVLFSGLAPGFVGLGQANVLVPALPSNDYPLVLTVNGQASNGATVAVKTP